ncbi:MAG TPA: single-stranded-DNA-specific exonuclease RecJ [Candidatus Omnitrophota bacterium]|nr:single-stranded-DNA-specific exonuclease RecJ [Candidatus Omnitrophota bacterium]
MTSRAYSPVFQKLLEKRGFTDPRAIESFLHPDLSRLHDPLLMKNMREVKARLETAIRDKEKILIHGDYDADGITGVAVMVKMLEKLGGDFITFLPERERDGYGVSEEAIRKAHQKNARLLVTIDCGITAREEIRLARSLGLEVIVIDHHRLPADDLPDTNFILNPLQEDCPYPFKDLSAAGLVFKLAQSMVGESAAEWLDLVAISTISDIAPLRGENRTLAKFGLQALGERKNVGIQCLAEIAKLKSVKIDTGHVGFVLGPRINAAGRMSSPDTALRLLLTPSKREAASLANILNEENKARQRQEREITREAIAKVERTVNFNKERVIVLDGREWHQGVIGIVASRLVEKYERPAIVISVAGGVGKGSGRSIKGFHLFNALRSCAGKLEEFGGHEQAAGLSILEKNIDGFRKSINEYAFANLDPAIMVKAVPIDLEIGLKDLTSVFIRELELMEPFGAGNPRPVFLTRRLQVKSGPRKVYGETYEVVVSGEGVNYSARINEKIMYRLAAGRPERKYDLAYSVRTRVWDGIETLSLDAKEMKESPDRN